MTEPSAKVILDSLHPDGVIRATTMVTVMHRLVLSEYNTHRRFSRNSASSRAIPLAKQLERVRNDPALPVSWPKERGGMQGGPELDEQTVDFLINSWRGTANYVASVAEEFGRRGLHKSVANRLLEPFLWHTVITTSTEWDNFWGLRCNPLAQPEMRAAAEAMKAAYDASKPEVVEYGNYHLPLVDKIDLFEILSHYGEELGYENAKK